MWQECLCFFHFARTGGICGVCCQSALRHTRQAAWVCHPTAAASARMEGRDDGEVRQQWGFLSVVILAALYRLHMQYYNTRKILF